LLICDNRCTLHRATYLDVIKQKRRLPFLTRPGLAAAQAIGKILTKRAAQVPGALIKDNNTALREE
jgi:hypothetical protein